MESKITLRTDKRMQKTAHDDDSTEERYQRPVGYVTSYRPSTEDTVFSSNTTDLKGDLTSGKGAGTITLLRVFCGL